MSEDPPATGHTPIREVTSVDDLVTVTITCPFDGFVTTWSNYIAEEASTLAAADWETHAPDVPL